ncbi:MAG: hypothetical protein HFG54_05865 [Lachnospiraceae bacterium]|jgi:tight adherence protein C|nr:hypothetical protein [Lachnospiraceae bacterium]
MKGKKQWFIPLVCVIGSIVLYGTLRLTDTGQSIISPDMRINRESHGGEEREYQVWVGGLGDEPVAVTVPVKPQIYTAKEAEEVFEKIMEQMGEQILGENPSLMEVRSDLSLPSQIDGGVRLRWYSSDSEILAPSGKLLKEAEKELFVILSVELSAGAFKQSYEFPVRVLPPIQNEEERRIAEFLMVLRQRDEEQKEEPWISLPESFQGRKLSYWTEENSGYEPVILLGILLAVLLTARQQSQIRQENQKRERELLLDYSDVLSKLMVLTGAGLTVRNAWEKMVWDYETGRKQKKQQKRAAYEEMSRTYYQMQGGMSEGEAYREFGRRCRLQPYLKLSGLLEQNRKSGTKNMRAILQTEMADALEQRKNLARRLGEEAGTKLLLPLFLMLGIVMVMIMVPAMMTMG